MKKKVIFISIFSLLISVNALESNLFNTNRSNEMIFITKNIDNNIIPRTKNIKGYSIFKKYFQSSCKMSAKTFASKHTQDEWEEIEESGRFQEDITHLCPAIKESYQKEWTEELYHFFYEYAYDSDKLLIS